MKLQYLLTSIDTHLDFGFGITGESYFNAAEHLQESQSEMKVVQQAEMPINFLHRHSIELLLKSLIIIFHNQLKLPFDNEVYNSKKPMVLIDSKWKPLYSCHWIDKLYSYWLNELLLKHKKTLYKLAPTADWEEAADITQLFPLIACYDSDSLFFRYPVTKDTIHDFEKYSMQKVDLEKTNEIFNTTDTEDKSESELLMLIKNDSEEIIEAFEKQNQVLADLTQALGKLAHYFYCIHMMTRAELCDGR